MGFAETFKALSDSVRRDILMLLREGRMSAGEIGSHFNMTGATFSYHLNIFESRAYFLRQKEELYLLHAEHFCRRGSNAVAFELEREFF